MQGWRVPLVLLAVVILLGVILGVKVMNNIPEKQLAELKNNYNSNVDNDIDNNTLTEDEKYLEIINKLNEQRENSYKEKKKQEDKKETFSLITSVVILISYYIIHYKMKVRENFIKYVGIAFGAIILSSLLGVYQVMYILLLVLIILQVVIMMDIYRTIGVNPLLALTEIIPIVGTIVDIMARWKLGDYYGKETGFKLGLVFLPFIFLPILALTAEA